MNDGPARFARTLLFAFSLVPEPASAAGDPFCGYLLILDRLPGHARNLLASDAPASAHSAYEADIARASIWLEQVASGAIRHEEAETVGRAVDHHRRFLSLVKTGADAKGTHMARSQDWRRMDAWVDEQLRLRHCSGTHSSRHRDAASTVIASDRLPTGSPASSLDHTGAADLNVREPLFLVWGLLGLLTTLGIVVAGGGLLFRLLDRRDAPRFYCFINGALQGHLYCESTEIVDISRAGCKLRLFARFAPDRPLTLFFGNVAIPARAIWSNKHYAGLRFDENLTPAQLRNILDQAGRRRDDDGPLVPSLPCHDGTCRSVCPDNRLILDQKNGIRSGGLRRVDKAPRERMATS